VTALTAAVVAAVDFPVGVGVQPTRDGTKPFAVIYPDAGVRSALTMKANDGTDETWIMPPLRADPGVGGGRGQQADGGDLRPVSADGRRPDRALPGATVGAAAVA
jgi:hypothetical protein